MIKTVYLVSFNLDSCEGRGPMVPKAIFTSEKEAQKFADDHDPYKQKPSSLNKVEAFKLCDYAYESESREDIRNRAVKKLDTFLTKEEKEILLGYYT